MKTFIKQFNFLRLKRDPFFTNADYLLKQAKQDAAVAADCAEYVSALDSAVASLDQAMLRSRKAEQTAEITTQNSIRISVYSVFDRLVKTMQKSLDNSMRAAADNLAQAIVDNRFRTNGSINSITGALTNLCQDLNGKYQSDVEKIGAKGVVQQLTEANDAVFNQVYMRDEYYSTVVLRQVEMEQQKTSDAIDNLIQCVNSKAFLDQNGRYDSFINFTNALIVQAIRFDLRQTAKSMEPLETPDETETPGQTPPTTEPETPPTTEPETPPTTEPETPPTTEPETPPTTEPETPPTTEPETPPTTEPENPGGGNTDKVTVTFHFENGGTETREYPKGTILRPGGTNYPANTPGYNWSILNVTLNSDTNAWEVSEGDSGLD